MVVAIEHCTVHTVRAVGRRPPNILWVLLHRVQTSSCMHGRSQRSLGSEMISAILSQGRRLSLPVTGSMSSRSRKNYELVFHHLCCRSNHCRHRRSMRASSLSSANNGNSTSPGVPTKSTPRAAGKGVANGQHLTKRPERRVRRLRSLPGSSLRYSNETNVILHM